MVKWRSEDFDINKNMPVKVTLHEVGCGTQLSKRYSKKSSTAVSDGVTFDDLSPFLAYHARVSRDALGTIVTWSSLEWPREKDLSDDSTPDCSSEIAKSTAGQSDLHRPTELFTNTVPAVDPTGSSKSSREHGSSGFRNSQLRTPSPKVGAHQSVREDKGSRSSPPSSAISSRDTYSANGRVYQPSTANSSESRDAYGVQNS
jgi:hypothetical protein